MRIAQLSTDIGTIEAAEKPRPDADFTGALQGAVRALEGVQLNADLESAKLAAGAGNLHETTIALEKADVALRLAVKARSKVVDAYQEIMRMSV